MEQQQQDAVRVVERNPFFGVNYALLSCMWLVDIVFNASIEFGDLPGQEDTSSSSNTIMTMVQVLLQIFALINLLALLGATFLFRSGLFYMLFAEFRAILFVQPAYMLLTILLSMARLAHLNNGADIVEIWDATGYPVLSCIQKLGAVVYYFCSIYAVEKLRHPKFYSHEHWMR
uniref:Transmembrane protein 138 n=1 Tax=Globisporangium ultimum (strain ATCC 200006 / CBS 805.95 / DAOM BR144) TaxID=431595 RepID=K3WYL5_GLOUD